MNKLAKAITDLSPEQRARLELLLMKKRGGGTHREEIAPRPDANTFPLSAAQQRLWSLDQLVPEAATYNIHKAFLLRGPLDVALLEQSLCHLLHRHETLRATFANVAGQPVQQISPPGPYSLAVVDLQEFPEADREAEAARLAKQEARQPFDLARGPLLRATLLRLGREEHMLLLTMHHIVCDGWSFGVFIRELGALYAPSSGGSPSPLPQLPLQYADFAYWQHQWLQSPALEAQLTYWHQQLGGSAPALQLPTDRPHPSPPTSRGASQSRVFSKDLTEALRRLSRQEQVTLFMTLLAGFQTLLNRYTGQENITVCSPIAGRKRVEIEGLIGYFNNILVLRTDLSGNPNFRELLGRVREVVLEAYDHQDVPFQHVANLPNLARIPLSRALFALQDALGQLEFPGIAVQSLDVESETADFALALFIEEQAETLIGVLRYKTDLFSAEAIARMLSHFQTLLESIVDNPEQQLLSLPRLADTKPHQRIGELSATSNNKDSRALSAPDAVRPGVEESFVAPRNALELRLTKIWEKVLAIQPVGVRDNFFSLGGHSLLALRLFVEIEKVTNRHLPLAILFQAPTIEQLARILHDEGWSGSWSSLVPLQPAGSKPPFFCVHAHGGNVVGYYDLARHLGTDQPFYGLQAQGLDGKTTGFCRLEEMAAHYIEEIRTVQPQGPYYLGGYCFGGEVAFEMAQQLQAQGEEVACLALMQSTHPDYPRFLPNTTLFRRLIYRVIARIDLELSNFLEVKPTAKLAYCLARVRRIMIMVQVKVERMIEPLRARLRLRSARSHAYALKALEATHEQARMNYKPRPYKGRVIVFRANRQPLGIHPDPTLGWSKLVEGELELQEVPGHPIGILSEPRVQIVAEQLRVCIHKAQVGVLGG